MSSRENILAALRTSLRGQGDPAAIEARLAAHAKGLIPARGQLDASARIELFIAMAEEVSVTATRLTSMAEVPASIAG